MSSSRVDRLAERLQKQGMESALVSSLANLRYFSGFTAAIETGPSPFCPVQALLVVVRGEKPLLLVADCESVEGVYEEIQIETFASYTIETPVDSISALNAKLSETIGKLPAGLIGYESEALPAAVCEALTAKCPQLQLRDISELASGIRTIKDEDEIEVLRKCCSLCDIGQEIVKRRAQPGMTELELFAEVRKGMETAEGGRLPLLADLVTGPRTALVGGSPTLRKLEPGDLVLADLVPRHDGYWGDSCNTCVVGDPSDEQRTCFEAVSEILQQAIESVRPGLCACDLDSFVRSRIQKLGGEFPHHTGHGIGVTWHEEPRIVPYNLQPLEENMVIALEPGVYFSGRWGIRLEYVVRVTSDGAEVLSGFKHTL